MGKKAPKEDDKDEKKDEKEVKGAKGLTAKQKKLPAGLQAKNKKKHINIIIKKIPQFEGFFLFT
jgi:hypothetical protein